MKKIDVKIINTRKQFSKWSFRPTFKREKQFRNRAIATEKRNSLISLIKPTDIRETILERKVKY